MQEVQSFSSLSPYFQSFAIWAQCATPWAWIFLLTNMPLYFRWHRPSWHAFSNFSVFHYFWNSLINNQSLLSAIKILTILFFKGIILITIWLSLLHLVNLSLQRLSNVFQRTSLVLWFLVFYGKFSLWIRTPLLPQLIIVYKCYF